MLSFWAASILSVVSSGGGQFRAEERFVSRIKGHDKTSEFKTSEFKTPEFKAPEQMRA
jgi:hypothetical protein